MLHVRKLIQVMASEKYGTKQISFLSQKLVWNLSKVAICWQQGQIGLVSFEDQNCKFILQCCGPYVDTYPWFFIKIYMPTDFGDKRSSVPKKIQVQKGSIPLCGIHMESMLISIHT
jgi:hypothetical protein